MNVIIYYLNLLSKLNDIINELDADADKLDADIKKSIINSKNLCLAKLKSFKLIQIFVENLEVKNDDDDPELTQQLNNISTLLGGPQEMDNTNFDPSIFENFGKGLTRILSVQPQPQPQPQQQQLPKNVMIEIKKKVKQV